LNKIKRKNGILTIKIGGDYKKAHYKVVWDGVAPDANPTFNFL
jgi:hypothetical protein